MGFDGQIVKNMLTSNSRFKGHAAYYTEVIRILGTFRERKLDYEMDGISHSDSILLIIAGNGTTFGGGFKLVPDARVNDGFVSVCVIRKIHPVKRFLYLNRLKKGKHGRINGVSFHKVKNLKILQGNIPGQVDGEYCGYPPFNISIAESRLKVLCK